MALCSDCSESAPEPDTDRNTQVLGFVFNKRMLKQAASAVVSLVSFVFPVVIESAVELSPKGLDQMKRDLIAPLRAENAALLAALGAQNATLHALNATMTIAQCVC